MTVDIEVPIIWNQVAYGIGLSINYTIEGLFMLIVFAGVQGIASGNNVGLAIIDYVGSTYGNEGNDGTSFGIRL